jgi:hypothetical protein
MEPNTAVASSQMDGRASTPSIIKAVVHKIYLDGPHGDYALARPKDYSGPIIGLTFSLENHTWKESRRPEQGEIVCLGCLIEKRAGWQAREARFWSEDDETERLKNLPLKDRLAYYTEKSKTYSGNSGVIIEFNQGAEINQALRAMNEEEKIEIFGEFISSLNDRNPATWSVKGKNIGLTVSADGRQIKAWLGFPDLLIKNHAEGENFLFELSGRQEIVAQYLSMILASTRLREANLPNGMSLYLNWQ